jgi:hypothetical protein
MVAATDKAVLDHPAVRIEKAGEKIVSAHVNRSYMEKSEVQWWRVQELTPISAARTSQRAERFRPYFLCMLPHILEVLRNKNIKHMIIRDLPFPLQDHVIS